MEQLKDINGRVVHVGDKVALLSKDYCYRGLKNARLIKITYLGKGKWGYEFGATPKCTTPYRVREPECVRI